MTTEQEELLIKSRESLDAAKLLHEHEHFGPAASRAYYVMFYAAKALILGEGLEHSKHSAVVAAFGQHFSKTGRLPAYLHRYLNEGMTTRHFADYATKPVSDEESQEQIGRAEEFLRAAEDLLAG